jgi:hypothetical protein
MMRTDWSQVMRRNDEAATSLLSFTEGYDVSPDDGDGYFSTKRKSIIGLVDQKGECRDLGYDAGEKTRGPEPQRTFYRWRHKKEQFNRVTQSEVFTALTSVAHSRVHIGIPDHTTLLYQAEQCAAIRIDKENAEHNDADDGMEYPPHQVGLLVSLALRRLMIHHCEVVRMLPCGYDIRKRPVCMVLPSSASRPCGVIFCC